VVKTRAATAASLLGESVRPVKFDWFMKGIAAAVVLAFEWPQPVVHGGFLHPQVLNKLGIAVVFYLNGLSLSMQSLRHGASRWQVHLLIQFSTFALFPLPGLGLFKLGQGWMSPELMLGFFYLCAKCFIFHTA
jgi:sodium/bile acid cotransporter 7